MHALRLSLLLLLASFSLTHATFTPETLPGRFRLTFGLTICPDVITFTQPGVVHPSSTLLFDTRPITGGTLSLFPNPSTGGSGFIRHFSVHRELVGTYYGGTLSSRIQWDASALGADTYFVFFNPERNFRTTWEDVIGKNQPLQDVSEVPVYWFERGHDYIVINNRCLLQRESYTTTGNSGGNSGDLASAGMVVPPQGGSCFPADAEVITAAGVKRIDKIEVGDSVSTGKHFSDVIAFTHRDAQVRGYNYMTITLSNGRSLTLTDGHYVYANGKTVPASVVKRGDVMNADGVDTAVVTVQKSVFATGLYNPQTRDGDIVVNGIKVSTYTTAVPRFTAHALLAPVRLAYAVWRLTCEVTNSRL